MDLACLYHFLDLVDTIGLAWLEEDPLQDRFRDLGDQPTLKSLELEIPLERQLALHSPAYSVEWAIEPAGARRSHNGDHLAYIRFRETASYICEDHWSNLLLQRPQKGVSFLCFRKEIG
jgi:hypothetical protein